MKRITITLTDAEYGDLERMALDERRTPREMAAYLVVKNTPKTPTIGTLRISTTGTVDQQLRQWQVYNTSAADVGVRLNIPKNATA